MKSQPDIKIRRLAVFGGYGDLDAGTVWSRLDANRPALDRVPSVDRRPRQPALTVIQLDAVHSADVPLAA